MQQASGDYKKVMAHKSHIRDCKKKVKEGRKMCKVAHENFMKFIVEKKGFVEEAEYVEVTKCP